MTKRLERLERLGVEQLALWQHHRPDPKVPDDEVFATLKEIADSGKVARVGLSNANPEQIRTAHAVLGDALVSVQNQFSPAFRSSRPEIDVCEELGLAFLPWSPLGGLGDAKELAATDEVQKLYLGHGSDAGEVRAAISTGKTLRRWTA